MTNQIIAYQAYLVATGREAAEANDWDQGFIDQWGRFYTREEAWKIVEQNGQRFDAVRNGPSGVLFSEGIY